MVAAFLFAGCGDDEAAPADAASDSAVDAGPVVPASTDHCAYAPMPATARAGGTVEPGAISAGAAEGILPVPVGATLGAYAARAGFLGSGNKVDRRFMEIAGAFNPSIGVETWPKMRALALTAGDETVVVLKVDLGIADDDLSFRVAAALGPDFAGKVLLVASHSHSGWGHFSTHSGLQVGFGAFRPRVQRAMVDALVELARDALDARVPARIGVAHDPAFDPEDRVNRDRRGENDELAGGRRDDHDLFVVRVDAAGDGRPIALLSVFGMHGTLMDADNQLASTDAPGGVERALEESFDEPVVVMHLQGTGGDVSPVGTGGVECEGGWCHSYARAESVGRWARDAVLEAWAEAEGAAVDTVELEMVTRSIPLGPDWRTFTVRGGALEYAPFDGETDADGIIYGDDGAIVSPVDEFNAPFGAALCGEDHDAFFPMGQLPGTRRAGPYRSCVSVDVAATILGETLVLPFEARPVCGSTRTTLSAIRLGEWLLVSFPGEPLTLYGDHVRSLSPVAPERTIVLGYAQDHMGYLLTADDWLLAGYEPSINFWGPLEGEHVAAQAAALMQLAVTDEREDATEGAADRWAPPDRPDELPIPDPSPMAGTVPETVPEQVFVRGGAPITDPRPPASVPRLGVVRMAWIGEDPLAGSPRVTLQRETAPGASDFEDVARRSGRPVSDQDFLLFHTPAPLLRDGDSPRTHYWVVEWQAVTPWGTASLDDVEDRAGLPLGRYRIHVEGTGYTLDSDPIEVVPGSLTTDVEVVGTTVVLRAGYLARDGFRLLDLTEPSNRYVPLRRGPVRVEVELADASTRTFDDVAPDAPGELSVELAASDPAVTRVRVEDRFGNSGEVVP